MIEIKKLYKRSKLVTSFLLERVNSTAIITYHTGEVHQNVTGYAKKRGVSGTERSIISGTERSILFYTGRLEGAIINWKTSNRDGWV